MNDGKHQEKLLSLTYPSLFLIGIVGFSSVIIVYLVVAGSISIDIASGKTYSVDAVTSTRYPDTGTEITDDVYGSAVNPFDPAWSGYDYNQDADFTIDLGDTYTINSIVASFLRGFESWAIYLPSSVTAECSYDDISYNSLGTLVEEDNTGNFKLNELNQECRYVRVNTAHVGWMFIDEIDVYEQAEDGQAEEASSPRWRNQGQSATMINVGDSIELYAQGYDETGLDCAWLETNETGVWEKTGEIRYRDNLIPNQDFNLLPNHDFEIVAYYGDYCSDMYGYRPFPWGFERFAGSPSFLVDKTTSYSGSVSTKITGKSDRDAGVVAIPNSIDKVRVTPGLTYRQCAWIKYDVTGNYGVRFMHQFFKAPCLTRDIIKTEYGTFYKGNSDWTFVCFDSTAPANSVCGDAVLELWGNGNLWVDDFRFWPLDDSPPTDMKNTQNIWLWANFTWQNPSVAAGTTVGWKIYYNDTSGNENVTDIRTFTIQPMGTCIDNDGDGYGDPASASCTYSGLDCDDSNPDVHPGSTEVCNGIDDNCVGGIDEGGNALCDDGLWCNGEEICNANLGCQPGTPVNCDDSNECTQDSCNEAIDSCRHINVADNTYCTDGVCCSGTCKTGVTECPIAVKCWSASYRYLYMNSNQMRKFCKCAQGTYGYNSYNYRRWRRRTVWRYVDPANNENWEVTSRSSYRSVYQVKCTDGLNYPTNQDYYYPK